MRVHHIGNVNKVIAVLGDHGVCRHNLHSIKKKKNVNFLFIIDQTS
jgi:hypothetical protein